MIKSTKYRQNVTYALQVSVSSVAPDLTEHLKAK
jgi:hypothetical protein